MNPEKAPPIRGQAPVKLTLEEIKVLKECRVNSVFYRGLPMGIASIVVARTALSSGYFPRLKRWQGVFYTGMFGFGFMSGVVSYRDECLKKIMALENSVLAEQFRSFQKKVGMPVTHPPNRAFETTEDEQSLHNDLTFDRDHDSQLLTKIEPEQENGRSNKWEELRQRHRQYNAPTSSQRGITHEELRKKNQSSLNNEGDSQSLLQNENNRLINLDSYQSATFYDDRKSSVLDFSRDDDSRSSDYSPDIIPQEQRDHENRQPRMKKTFAEATGRRNKYGDLME